MTPNQRQIILHLSDGDWHVLTPQFSPQAIWCARLGDALGVAYMIENPVSVLATLWRKPDYSFNPFDYGGYIPEDEAEHPTWPQYIAARDAYPKKTCLWTGGGFVMPEPMAVDCAPGYSTQHKKLGGKSMRTKNIRSATPRGLAAAVFAANSPIRADRAWPHHAVAGVKAPCVSKAS